MVFSSLMQKVRPWLWICVMALGLVSCEKEWKCPFHCGQQCCGADCPAECLTPCNNVQKCNPQSCLCESPCVPETCEEMQVECGSWPNSCGSLTECLDCSDQGPGWFCGQGKCLCQYKLCHDKCCAEQEICSVKDSECCLPQTCSDSPQECGEWIDRCGAGHDCSTCTDLETCSEKQCVCKWQECGMICCAQGQVCSAADGTCCTPQECAGSQCEKWTDSCGVEHDCGPCLDVGAQCISGSCRSLGIEWISLEPNSSWSMGSEEGVGESDEHPKHSVSIKAFDITKTEVTASQYQACVEAKACEAPGTQLPSCNAGDPQGRADFPANCLNWEKARAFCAWLGGRLPTEAEWEYAAAGGGQGLDYPWGAAPATCDYAVMLEGDVCGCGTDLTAATCSKEAGNSSQELCDLGGNVWEWIQDHYHYSYEGAPADGSAWEDAANDFRVVRGGSYCTAASELRVRNRSESLASIGGAAIGFRCVKAPTP